MPSDGSGLGVSRRERRRAQKERRKAALKRAAKNTISARLGVSTEEVSPYVRKDRQFKTFKPITRSLRWLRYPLAEHLWRGKPERSLTIAKRGKGGRNHHGHITVRSRGGGHRRRIRLVDFYRWEAGEQTVLRIEYDPGRSAHVALIEHNETKRRSYILATEGIREGDTVQSYRTGVPKSVAPGQGQSEQFEAADGVLEEQIPTESVPSMPAQTPTDGASPASLDPSAPQTTEPPSLMPGLELEADAAQSEAVVEEAPADSNAFNPSSLDLGIFRTQAIRPGNVLPLRLIPIGTTIHAISLLPTGPAKLVRSAGTFGQLVSFSSRAGAAPGRHAQIRLQSGEVRLVPVDCCACIGVVSNPDHQHRRIGKAGRSRWLGRRPHVRGVAMNA